MVQTITTTKRVEYLLQRWSQSLLAMIVHVSWWWWEDDCDSGSGSSKDVPHRNCSIAIDGKKKIEVGK